MLNISDTLTRKNISSAITFIMILAAFLISTYSCYRSNLVYKHVNSVYTKILEANDVREKLFLATTLEQKIYFQNHLAKIDNEMNVLQAKGDALRKKWF